MNKVGYRAGWLVDRQAAGPTDLKTALRRDMASDKSDISDIAWMHIRANIRHALGWHVAFCYRQLVWD